MRIEKGDVHQLPLPHEIAGMQGRQDCGSRKHPGGDVNNRYAYARWRPIHWPSDTHHPALGLENRVITGALSKRAGASITTDRAID